MRLTINTSAASDWVLSKDGEKLFYLTSFEKGNDLWVTEVRTRETKLFNKLGANTASMELSPDGKFLFVVADGKAVKVDTESGKSEPIAVNTEMVLDYSAEKAYIFDHSWRQFKQKLVFPDLQKVDWDFYYTTYKKFLPHINNNYDFAEMLSEMLGEMNVSHTGCLLPRQRAQLRRDRVARAALRLRLHRRRREGSPRCSRAGRWISAASTIKAGHVIEAIDGNKIDAAMDFYRLLNRKAGKFTLLVGLRSRVEQALGGDRQAGRTETRKTSCSTNAGYGGVERTSRSCQAAKSVTSMSARTTMRACAWSSRRRSG